MASMYVDIDLSEVDSYELIDALEICDLSENDKKRMIDILFEQDKKIEFFLSVKDRYSLTELQELFAEQYTTSIPKEQLKIEFNT